MAICTPLPKCEDCPLRDTESCVTCPKTNSEGLDNFDDEDETDTNYIPIK